MGVPNAAMWGMVVAVLNFVPTLARHRSHRAGHGGSAYFRHAVARTPAVRLVPAAASVRNKPHYAGVARAPVYTQSRGHFCFLDLLDVALGVPGALLSVAILVSIKVISDRVPAMSSVSDFFPISQQHFISGSK